MPCHRNLAVEQRMNCTLAAASGAFIAGEMPKYALWRRRDSRIAYPQKNDNGDATDSCGNRHYFTYQLRPSCQSQNIRANGAVSTPNTMANISSHSVRSAIDLAPL